jgi:hypothetical protein
MAGAHVSRERCITCGASVRDFDYPEHDDNGDQIPGLPGHLALGGNEPCGDPRGGDMPHYPGPGAFDCARCGWPMPVWRVGVGTMECLACTQCSGCDAPMAGGGRCDACKVVDAERVLAAQAEAREREAERVARRVAMRPALDAWIAERRAHGAAWLAERELVLAVARDAAEEGRVVEMRAILGETGDA